MRFEGKVSWWFYAIIIGVAAFLIPLIIVSACVEPNAAALITTLAVFLVVELFCLSIVLHNYVELQDEALLIVFGFIKKKIPYSDILSISTTRDASSSLAASLDRIEVKYKNKSAVMISVMDKEGFFNKMKEYNPNMIICQEE
ncbi:PH domain-containing protein [Frisingicoccus sp.]|uniref:PH domain-containing protein n=1 Tax=Frisingicoccus sp. TaxID=1918627 RepID=UPI003AB184D2